MRSVKPGRGPSLQGAIVPSLPLFSVFSGWCQQPKWEHQRHLCLWDWCLW